MGFKTETARSWLIRWMYAVTFGHFAAGVLLAWFSSSNLFEQYHHTVVAKFDLLQTDAQALQEWWLSLFGATLQNLAIFMGVLIYFGNRYRHASLWFWIMIGLLVWVPQDMLISLRIDLWLHVWIDIAALILMLPPLLVLWQLDRKYCKSQG